MIIDRRRERTQKRNEKMERRKGSWERRTDRGRGRQSGRQDLGKAHHTVGKDKTCLV